eukprot:TRINITY_DN5579_c0_g1_i1.p1 TRINITY_DN5579_c0_g1~~TRINITY_DN5579_c0_g1_i1.p1  ORF type:complete len:344 (-),score=57.25 TRINITY_DN5579_c0_g1_i1:183-1214(-)
MASNNTEPKPPASPKQEVEKSEIKKSSGKLRGLNLFFKSLSILMICVVFGAWSEIVRFEKYTQIHRLRYWDFTEFAPSLLIMLGIFAYRYSFAYLLRDWVDSILDPNKYTGEERKAHIKRMIKWICDIIYYTAATVFAYWVFWDSKHLPSCLGGKGDCGESMRNYPNQEELPYVRVYYLLQIGNHLFAFFDQLIFKKLEKNFHEMMLHHILALSLTMMSFQMNLVYIGMLVLIVHDPGDVLLCCSRFYSDLKKRSMTPLYFIFIANLACWIYLRLYVFPTCIIFPLVKAFMSMSPDLFAALKVTLSTQILMLALLFVMHIYWVSIMTQRAFSVVVRKKKIRTT